MTNTTEKAMDTTKLLLRASEVAERLSIGRGTAYELMASGILPTVRIGRSVRATAAGVEEIAKRPDLLTTASKGGATRVP